MKKHKRPKRRINKSKLIIKGLLILAVFYVFTVLYDQYKEMEYLKYKEESLVENINIIEEDIQLLKDQIENSNTDEHIEKIAREQLKMVKKDELIFIDSSYDLTRFMRP